MSELRENIVRTALWWTGKSDHKDGYQVTPEELVLFFKETKCEAAPTLKEAEYAVRKMGSGVKVQGHIKHWCGVFGVFCYVSAGVDVRWSLVSGRPEGPGVRVVYGSMGIAPGDIAIMKSGNHHYVVTDIDYEKNLIWSVDGNSGEQRIRKRERNIKFPKQRERMSVYAYYRVVE